MALIENSLSPRQLRRLEQLQRNRDEIAPLKLPKLYWPADLLRMSITQEAVKAARLYQEAMGSSTVLETQTEDKLLDVASAHYRRRPDTDWVAGSVEYPVA